MPKRKEQSSLSAMIDDGPTPNDTEATSSHDDMPTQSQPAENAVPTKRARGRPKATSTKTSTSKSSTAAAKPKVSSLSKKTAAVPKAGRVKRIALKEQQNGEQAGDTDDADDLDEGGDHPMPNLANSDEDAAVPARKPGKKRGRKPASKVTGTANSLESGISVQREGQASQSIAQRERILPKEHDGMTERVTAHRGRSEGLENAAAGLHTPTRETDVSMIDAGDDLADEQTPRPRSALPGRPRSISTVRQRLVSRKRAGSASDNDRSAAGTDPAIRRKLGEMTRRFESLEVKYKTLREVGVKEAETNFDRLRTQSAEKTEAANKLIASLKLEISNQANHDKETQSIQKQLSSSNAEMARLKAEVSRLSESLSNAQNENKKLSAKLAASRNTATTSQVDIRGLSSAIKASSNARQQGQGNAADAAEAARTAMLKEELYSDLTGLILRSVKRHEDFYVYDCLQTGRNGTFHFKLAVEVEGEKGSNYDDGEFVFTPLLDDNRDRDLMELLPDYLTAEITFTRENAGKFYTRVMETLTKVRKREVDD
ncbi:MAG: hypothetical protein M1825_005695 [Sarcosagium campestre]|nr:MAG: hypothetical protein M1825_005695 [Sarcosagium campestre]